MLAPLPHVSFYFLRHGVTDHNQRRVVMGQMDIPLNEQGRRQAHSAGRLLSSVRIQRIIASPLSRALETAQIVGRLCNLPEPEIAQDLRERQWGSLTGRSHRELFSLPRFATPDGAETTEAFTRRILDVVGAVIPHKIELPPVLIVAHAGACRILRRHMGLDDGEAPVPNAVPLLFSAQQDGGWREVRVV